jgi:hypothetical protein
MASRIITIKRRENTTNLPDHVYAESKRRIGSVFTKTGDVYSGLTFPEQKKFLPYILGVDPNDPAFGKEAKRYFRNMTIEVPFEGVELEAGTDENGEPLNVMDYVKYKFAYAHPHVAEDEQALTTNRTYKYYIFDETLELEEDYNELEFRKKAYKEFIKLTDNEKKMDMVIRLHFENPKKMDAKSKELFLEDMVEENPVNFYNIATSKNLELQAFIEECISVEVIRKIGNSLLLGDEKLGDTMEEAVLFLKDKKNSSTLTTLKARVQQYAE